MLFETIFNYIYKSPILNILILLLIIVFCYCVYRKSVESRKYYRCKECGESFRSEHMDSKCCKVCGGELEEIFDTDVNDKA